MITEHTQVEHDKKSRRRAKEKKATVARKPVTIQKFWRIVYWVTVLAVVAGICIALYYTLNSDFGQCSDYDVKCD